MSRASSLLIVVATEAEAPSLWGAEVLVCGVGKTGAACATATRLAQGGIKAVVSFGLAGAYPSARLSVGDVVVATKVCTLDEGLDTGERFVPFERPGMEVPSATWIPADPILRTGLLGGPHDSFAVATGPIATVSVCAGSDRLVRERERSGALAEGMEGAAIAHVAQHHGLPFAEVRGISNLCGPRDAEDFELPRPIANAGLILSRLPSQGGW
jgi:futalosine hydrolase